LSLTWSNVGLAIDGNSRTEFVDPYISISLTFHKSVHIIDIYSSSNFIRETYENLYIITTKYSVYTPLFISQKINYMFRLKWIAIISLFTKKYIYFTDVWIWDTNPNNITFQGMSNIRIRANSVIKSYRYCKIICLCKFKKDLKMISIFRDFKLYWKIILGVGLGILWKDCL
jgi:hypothetical protein